MGDADQQGRGDDEVAYHVSEPPGAPHGWQPVPVDLAGEEQAADPDGGADRRAHAAREQGQSDIPVQLLARKAPSATPGHSR
jgi:hypothetical protein